MAINFGPDPWGAYNQRVMRARARDPRHPLAYRIHFAALGWANNIGHSRFDGVTLAQILADAMGNEPTRQVIDKGIRKAKSLGLIAPDSCTRCLVVSGRDVQRGGQGSYTCSVHEISRGSRAVQE